MSLPPGYSISPAAMGIDYQEFANLALQYSQWLGVDLCFQAFEQELESLPGCYSPPGGYVLLLLHQPDECSPETAVGCVAVRPLHTNSSASRTPTPGPRQPTFQQQQNQQQPPPPLPPGADMQDADIDSTCEMKRLFVLSEHTGQGCGRALAAAAVAAAQEAGYARMVLDTLDTLTAANRLYEGLGFVR